MSFSIRRNIQFLLVFFFLAMLTLSGFAQTSTTGSIAGVVKDPSGAAVPGVVVMASGENLIRPQSATTASDGSYQIRNLPPGTYTLTIAEGKGFANVEVRDIEVGVTRTSTADLRLQLATAKSEVNVVEGTAMIDVVQTATGANVSSNEFSNFPTARTVQGLYTIAPTVTRSGLRDASGRDRDPSVAGSSGPENAYILDGVNTADSAFGGGGANLPFEFVQEVQVMTGAVSAEYGQSTGGIFNVITKSGGNDVHGDIFGYFTGQDLVRKVKNFPFTGSSANGFSEKDFGADIGGPIMKNKLWYYGAINPQYRSNFFLTQTFHTPVKNDVTIPFYAGKLTYAINNNNTLNFSTFGDFTNVEGFLSTAALNNVSGFGSDPNAFKGKDQTGGHNYTVRLNSVITPKWIAEVTMGLHYQRRNVLPLAASKPNASILDNFAVLASDGTTVLSPTKTGVLDTNNTTGGLSKTGFVDFVDGRGGSLQRNYSWGSGFGLYTNSTRNKYEVNAHLQNSFSKHTLKYGFGWTNSIYDNLQTSTGGPITYQYTSSALTGQTADNNQTINQRITNSFAVCQVQTSTIVCSNSTALNILKSLPSTKLPAGLTLRSTTGTLTTTNGNIGNPFLVRTSTRVRDFELNAKTSSRTYSGYLQDDWKLLSNLTLTAGLRWDFQESFAQGGTSYLKLNQFIPDTAPRLGLIWDFTKNGKGKFSLSYSRFIETPIPLDVNVRAGGGDSQIDKNFNVNTYNGPSGSLIVPGVGSGAQNLGADKTPVDPDLRPQSVDEYKAGIEYAVGPNIVLGVRGTYRNFANIIEDGSFDDGEHYFLFNPGRKVTTNVNDPRATTEDKACGDPTIGCFGHARRYYRGIEFTATKRFAQHYQFITSYTYSSLIGNYEGLFRNDNGQSDPNITSLFDLVSLLPGTTGRLPNDRPHQFKFNGSYETPFKLMVSGNFYVQSGSPFNMMTPHAVYGNNEGIGFCGPLNVNNPANPTPGVCTPRGTAIVPTVTATQPGFPNVVDSVGTRRTPWTSNLDLGFYYPIKMGEKREFRISADWFNALNQQRAVTLDQTFAINSGITGVAPIVNPFWGSALLVQAPSQWRFGAKFSF